MLFYRLRGKSWKHNNKNWCVDIDSGNYMKCDLLKDFLWALLLVHTKTKHSPVFPVFFSAEGQRKWKHLIMTITYFYIFSEQPHHRSGSSHLLNNLFHYFDGGSLRSHFYLHFGLGGKRFAQMTWQTQMKVSNATKRCWWFLNCYLCVKTCNSLYYLLLFAELA